MKILITGSCGHIGSYLSDNIHKVKNVSKTILVDNPFKGIAAGNIWLSFKNS